MAIPFAEQVVDYGLGDVRGRLHTSGFKELPVSSVGDANTRALILAGLYQHGREHDAEEDGREDTPLPQPVCRCEVLGYCSAFSYACPHPVVELKYHVDEVIWAAEFMHDFPQPVPVHCVEGFSQVQEGRVKLSRGKDHVSGAAIAAEATLAFRLKPLFQVVVEAIKEDTCEDLLCMVEQRDSSVIVAESSISFVLVEVDDCGVLEVLGYSPFMPYPLKECSEVVYALMTAAFENLSRDRVLSSCFPAG
ncbi:unnamed protein product [Dibothriocephalus latus]|uniref:Uncharacterized protein n=1 Tax=Dibothriocephalus latus TaxID=60516 RepID=A0A3P7LU41_DIBLA|nr:unnamed protein product [Dibothriocephalus latus]